MNEVKDKKKKNGDSKKITITLILILVLMVTTTGGTYAYLAISGTDSATITGTVATPSFSLNVQQSTLGGTNNSSVTKTNVMVPQLESALGTAISSGWGCVDGNGNTVCKVYTITITNASTAAVRVIGTIRFSNNNTMKNLKWKRIASATTIGNFKANNTSGTNSLGTTAYDLLDGTIPNTGTGTTYPTACTYDYSSGTSGTQSGCTTDTLAGNGGSKTYYIVVWINETGTEQTDSGTFTATIEFVGENGRGITSTITS